MLRGCVARLFAPSAGTEVVLELGDGRCCRARVYAGDERGGGAAALGDGWRDVSAALGLVPGDQAVFENLPWFRYRVTFYADDGNEILPGDRKPRPYEDDEPAAGEPASRLVSHRLVDPPARYASPVAASRSPARWTPDAVPRKPCLKVKRGGLRAGVGPCVAAARWSSTYRTPPGAAASSSSSGWVESGGCPSGTGTGSVPRGYETETQGGFMDTRPPGF